MLRSGWKIYGTGLEVGSCCAMRLGPVISPVISKDATELDLFSERITRKGMMNEIYTFTFFFNS